MQESFDFYSLITVVTFLGVLLFIAFYVNKKKDYFKNHINKNRSISIINSAILGAGNRAILFEVDSKKFLVVSNKSNISNIIPFTENNSNNVNIEKKNEKTYV